MEIGNSNAYGALDEARLADFEADLGFTLPEDYRDFLLAHNGGTPVPSTFVSAREGEDRIESLYGLHDGPDHLRLDEMWGIYRRRLPRGVLPVGDDPFGNAICIALAGRHRGRIYFWDHEREPEDDPFEALTALADGFTAFLASLR
ncbi:SMI1/KNR4 family protein [Arenibaculum sp.]|jgi:cell wall assembly regulator SMI1|uniref:SMI1/KNR4 family protein n=1 Tax=Arenibaculum sp. TaxID=2865862 RepID=UPI002E0F6423|nr:SMI1/KNR4 family protein [Arenibaculum sp.]